MVMEYLAQIGAIATALASKGTVDGDGYPMVRRRMILEGTNSFRVPSGHSTSTTHSSRSPSETWNRGFAAALVILGHSLKAALLVLQSACQNVGEPQALTYMGQRRIAKSKRMRDRDSDTLMAELYEKARKELASNRQRDPIEPCGDALPNRRQAHQ